MTIVPVRLDLRAPHAGLALSSGAVIDDFLFLAQNDAALLRLRRSGGIDWEDSQALPLSRVIDLPGGLDAQVDVTGIDASDVCLWATGSHAVSRRRVTPGTPIDAVGSRLARVVASKAQRFVARLPLVHGPGGPALAMLGQEVRGVGVAARLPAGRRGLISALADDEHLGPFLDIPGKDNGFDIGGIAVIPQRGRHERVVLGLRSPALRGWAVLLEIDVRVEDAELVLNGIRKSFINLNGLGVHDLARVGDDLLILAAPTMMLEGPVGVLRLPGGAGGELPPVVVQDETETIAELPAGPESGWPAGLAALDNGLLVLHDPSAPQRLDGSAVIADMLPLQAA